MSTASEFLISEDLVIGTVFEVSGNSIKIALDKNITELTRGYKGRVYSVGQLGSIIKLHMGRKLIFATVSLLRLQSDEETAAITATTGITSSTVDRRVLEADLLGEAWWHTQTETLDFKRGISTYPLPLQPVYLMTKAETQTLYESVESIRDDGVNCHVPIGTYIGASRVSCRANLDKLFGQHCAILGSTGSGKSGTVASILHSVIAHKAVGEQETKSRIVVIDPHGEYSKAFQAVSTAFKAYDSPHDQEDCAVKLKLPFWLMSSDEFRSLAVGKAEVEATSQANAVYKALTHARMAQAGLILKAEEIDIANLGEHESPQSPIPRTSGTQEEQQERLDAIASFDRDKPRPFQLNEFLAHITKLQSKRWHQSKWQDNTATELGKMASILDKIRVLKTDNRIQFLMNDYLADDLTLADVLKQFISIKGNNDTQIRIIDISGLPNEVAGPLTGAIARLLFQYKLNQSRLERERDPILLVCEEAHRYVPNRGDAQYAVAQDAIRRIAREGRKYGLGLMLVSQRPADVEGTVISQCNSWVVLRLSNSQDQQHVSRFLPDSLSNMTSALSSLPRQEALFVGEAAALPARIKINTLSEDKLPDSNDISFAKAWSADLPDDAFLDGICKNMQS